MRQTTQWETIRKVLRYIHGLNPTELQTDSRRILFKNL